MLPSRELTEAALKLRRVAKPGVAFYLRARYGVGRRTSRAAATVAFGALRILRVARRVSDVLFAPVRLAVRVARSLGSLASRLRSVIGR